MQHIAQFNENNIYGTLNHVVILALFGLQKIRRLICVLLKKLSVSPIFTVPLACMLEQK